MNRTRSDSRYLELESSSRRIVMATDPESFSVCVETNTSRPETHSPSLSLSPFSSLVIVALISQSTSPSLSFPLSLSLPRFRLRVAVATTVQSKLLFLRYDRNRHLDRAYMIARVSFLETGCPFRILFSPGATNVSRIHETIGSTDNDPRRETPPALSLRSSEGEVFVSFRFFSPIFFFPSGQSRTSWNVLKEIRRKRGRRGKDRRGRGRGERERERKSSARSNTLRV